MTIEIKPSDAMLKRAEELVEAIWDLPPSERQAWLAREGYKIADCQSCGCEFLSDGYMFCNECLERDERCRRTST